MSSMFASKSRAAPVRTFKKGMDNDDARRKREDNVISLRKTAREEHTQKRRVAASGGVAIADASVLTNLAAKAAAEPATGGIRDKLRELPALVAALQSDDMARQLESVTIFRKLLSIEQNPPIQEVIDTGIVRRLVALLSFDHAPQIQFEASWTLTNIASGTSAQTRAVVDGGAVPAFVRLLGSPAEDVREQSVWALGNIAGDCTAMRDYVLNENAFPALVSICVPQAKITMIRNAVWAMSNLCRGKPQPDFAKIGGALPKLVALLEIADVEVLTDACWALSYISDDKAETNPKIQAVIAAGACRMLVKLLQHPNDKVRTPALRTVGNIVTGDDHQTQAILAEGALTPLRAMLKDGKKGIRKEACWTLSNITAGSAQQIRQVLDADIFPRLIKLMNGSDYDVQKEAAWAMSNATSGGDTRTLQALAEQGAIAGFVELLDADTTDAKMINVCLDGLENMLRSGKLVGEKTTGENKMCEIVEEAGGLDTLEKLQQHENEEVYKKALKILKDYFEESDEDNDKCEQQLAPATAGNTFAFGAAPVAKESANPFGSSSFSFGGADNKPAAFSFGASTPAAAPSSNPFAAFTAAGPPVTGGFSF